MEFSVAKNPEMRREDIVTWLRRRKIILGYSIVLFSKKIDEANELGDVNIANKYGFLKRRAIQFHTEVKEELNEAFKLNDSKYAVFGSVSGIQPIDIDNSEYSESKEQKVMYRDAVAQIVGDVRSILYEVRNANWFKNPSYTRELTTWQIETRDVKNYILENYREDQFVKYDHKILPMT